jgi:hypothetical protein
MEVTQCTHDDLRKVLKFLLPLINPTKPNRVTIEMASTVMDCLINKNKVSWAKLFHQSIRKQVTKLDKVAISYLPAYANTLYVDDNALSKLEKKKYEALKWRLKSN